jgi:ornithine carbamoyltransferase
MTKRDLLRIADLTPEEIGAVLGLAGRLKEKLRTGRPHPLLAGRTLAMIFEKPSLRTRVTFEVGMVQLGGAAIHLAPGDIRLGERESAGDIARNLERWVDLVMARTFSHRSVADLAAGARVPVINGLSDLHHPCQVLSDCFTLLERRGRLAGLRVAFIGDGNNVARSLTILGRAAGIEVVVSSPPGFELEGDEGAILIPDPAEAVAGADAVYTDVWIGMTEPDAESKREALAPYRIDEELIAKASDRAIVLHCLPAHPGEEISEGVLYGERSAVFDQAENRLHAQKALLEELVD